MKSFTKKIWKKLSPIVHELVMQFLCRCRLRVRTHKSDVIIPNKTYVIGCFQAGGGISRSAQLYVNNLRSSGRDVICVDSTEISLQRINMPMQKGEVKYIDEIRSDCEPASIIIHHNPPQLQWILCALGKKFLEKKYITGYWAWELEDIPPLWKDALNYVDAVEVPSSFTKQAFLQHIRKPVVVKPHLLPMPKRIKDTYAVDGVLRCLFVMDMGSDIMRKNPEALIKIFSQTFSAQEAILTIKVIPRENYKDDLEFLQKLVAPFEHVVLRSDWLDDASLEQLYLDNDVYISFHRSEGYGLTIHEAMLHGLYIVATGWSGNMDFMHGEKAFPVAYTLVPIGKNSTVMGRVPYARWAEVSEADAIRALRDVYSILV